MDSTENLAPAELNGTEARPSKSRRKAEAHALQALGAELVALNRSQLAQVALPESLRDAVQAAQRIRAHEGRRRQLQYIGKLMRNVDAAPIRARIDGWKAVSAEQIARLHHIERWRERLLDDPAAVQVLADTYPQAGVHELRQQLRALIRNTLRERELKKPPKSYRALYQLLHDIIQSPQHE